jgi:hypothetical protein
MAQMLFIERIMKSQNCKEYKIFNHEMQQKQIRIYNNEQCELSLSHDLIFSIEKKKTQRKREREREREKKLERKLNQEKDLQ